jgi:hypothetical protein
VGAGKSKPDIDKPDEPKSNVDPAIYGEVEILWRQDAFDPAKVLGFNIYRSKQVDGPKKKINGDLILYSSAEDEIFEFYDHTAKLGELYFYHIEIVSRTGPTAFIDPIPRTVARKIQDRLPEITNESVY